LGIKSKIPSIGVGFPLGFNYALVKHQAEAIILLGIEENDINLSYNILFADKK